MTHCEIQDLSLATLTVLIEYIRVTIYNLKLHSLCNLNMEIPRGLCNQEVESHATLGVPGRPETLMDTVGGG